MLAVVSCRSRGQAIPTSLENVTEVEEGLVPGLDMCNHSLPAQARWQIQQVSLNTEADSPFAIGMWLMHQQQRLSKKA